MKILTYHYDSLTYVNTYSTNFIPFINMNTTELDNFSITNKSDLDKLSDAYEGNLLNYFYGFTPEESRKFNKLKRQIKRSK